MLNYIIRRFLEGIPIMLGVTAITFLLLNFSGGDPVAAKLGKSATPEDIAAMRAEYGLDKSRLAQYVDYLLEIAHIKEGGFGRSFVTDESVDEIILSSMGPSLSITLPALFFTTLLSLTIALISASNRGGIIDRGLMALAVVGMSVSFLVYIVVGQYLLAYKWGWFQIFGYDASWTGRWQYLALPILVSVIVATGYDVRFYRAALVEETTRLHVKTAMAKGLSAPVVMFKHVLRNAMIPIITRIMISVPFLITGSLLVEQFFGIPGLGFKVLSALNAQDYPLIKAITALVSLLFIAANILTDILYCWADPRVRLS